MKKNLKKIGKKNSVKRKRFDSNTKKPQTKVKYLCVNLVCINSQKSFPPTKNA
jgi:hypothetical protein